MVSYNVKAHRGELFYFTGVGDSGEVTPYSDSKDTEENILLLEEIIFISLEIYNYVGYYFYF